jgi:hypothetical protein
VVDSTYKVNILISAKDETSQGTKPASSAMDGLAKAAKLAATALAAYKMVQKGLEFAQLGAQVQATQQRFESFAGGADQAAEYLEALNRASYGTLDQMGAMASGAKLLQMGLVDDAAGMEQVSAMAIRLGDQTKSATDRMSDFALMLANQSIMRLDNFGISSGKVRERIEELQDATAGMTREEAFLIATLEQGQKALDTLGDTSGETIVEFGKFESAITDVKNQFAVMLSDIVGGYPAWDDLIARIRQIPVAVEQVVTLFTAWRDAYTVFTNTLSKRQALDEFENSLHRQLAVTGQVVTGYNGYRVAVESITPVVQEVDLYQKQYADAMAYTNETMTHSIVMAPAYYEALDTVRTSAAEAAIAQNNLAMSLKDASQAQIAQTAISQLDEMLQQDKISLQDHATATNEVMLAFGLATPESIALTEKLAFLNTTFADGKIDANNYADALAILDSQTVVSRDTVVSFATAINDIPEYKQVVIETVYRNTGGGPSAEYVPSSPTMGPGQVGGTTVVAPVVLNSGAYTNTQGNPDYAQIGDIINDLAR